MTIYDEAWVKAEETKRAWMHEHGLYKEDDEHSSCGVGLVASISGKPSRKVVEAGLDALRAIWHRGAVDADGKTGDGAGIHVQLVHQVQHHPRIEPPAARAHWQAVDGGKTHGAGHAPARMQGTHAGTVTQMQHHRATLRGARIVSGQH